jgi:predicted DNA-binding transcriptional regulator AlpA
MALTEKQKNNIYHLDSKTQLEIMHECAEALGLVDISEYRYATGEKRRTIYDKMNSGKINTFNIGIHKFPLLNY